MADTVDEKGEGTAAAAPLPARTPAALGKLMEVDLGPAATLRNIKRTEAAKRRLEAGEEGAVEEEEEEEEEEDTDGKKKKKKQEGKSWKGRKRRTSEDLKRDRLVEEVLRESKRE